MRTRSWFCVPVPWVLASSLWSGCIVEAPRGEASAERSRALVAQLPEFTQPLGATFGTQVQALGATLVPTHLAPGGQVRVSLYLKVLGGLTEDYLVFVHLENPKGPGRWLFDHSPAGGYRTSEWRKGEVLKDEFKISLPATYVGSSVRLWFGFWEPKSDTRLPVTNASSVLNDGANRVLLVEIPVE